jgi:5-methylcytosine-specific restriction endonuclease McrA
MVMKGQSLSLEHREKIRLAMQKFRGKNNPMSILKNRLKVSEAKRGKPALNFRGCNHPNWKGGNSKAYKRGYNAMEYKVWRKSVFERDDYTCQRCFMEKGQYITAHHLKSWCKHPDLRYDVNNGITLCEVCHSLTDNYKGRANR